MMTVERFHEVLDVLVEVGDVTIVRGGDYTDYDGTYVEPFMDMTFEDFEGFDEDWSEIFRDYSDTALVEELEEFISEVAEGDFYQTFEFDGVSYRVGYGSYDI